MLLRAFLILSIALCITAAAAQYGSTVELPVSGSVDERPFFASRRHPAIGYSETPSTDVVAELKRRVDNGTVKLRFEGRGGYLQSVMNALHVSGATQSVVFSKTSLQAHYISPTTPRAIFYSDDVSVAFIPDAPLLEIAALDPKQGVVFYAISQRPEDLGKIFRSDSCLSCHEAHESMDVPGFLAKSVGSGTAGETLSQFGDFVSDHRSPFEERWGGWFITGKTGTARHMGNVLLKENTTAARRPYGTPVPLASLEGKFNLDGYPSRYSDVAAVMVLDHQVKMINMLTRVGWETRVALDQAAKHPGEKATAERLIQSDATDLVDYLFFIDEAPLTGTFESTSGFQAQFEASGVRDSRGRSLKQLDLGSRLMKYPCSYMIYSPAFDELPGAARDAVFARMSAVLSGKEKAAKYARLSTADRADIISILKETKPDFRIQ